ncbi:MAG: cytochrome c biogenesis protein CcsA [Rhodospirillales bacterium]|nr:cytochrome c biogenesis protein CcsA [Rhodospirillales bacterium]
MHDSLFNLSALIALVPAVVVGFRREGRRDGVFWLVLAVALAGPLAWIIAQTGGAWRTGFSTNLWVSVAASLGVFVGACAATSQAWRLLPLVAPYLLMVGILATIWQRGPDGEAITSPAAIAWVHLHIVVSVATYALVTVAAVAALGAFVQERALKLKRPSAVSRRLPPVADCESLVVTLLAVGEAVLALGMISGMAMQYADTGVLMVFDHKTVLAVAAFLVIGVLLIAHYRTGVRGRVAARLVLLAYLLLTLGYPGVKFVTSVLLS